MPDIVPRADLVQELVRLALESGDRTFQVIETQQGIVDLRNRTSRHRVMAARAAVLADRSAYHQLQASGWLMCHWSAAPGSQASTIELTQKAMDGSGRA